jgi:CubicO group peptidase (beta-lactamase class C family)
MSLKAKLDEAAVDKIFAALDQGHLPGAAVAVAIDGVPVYRKGFGLANMELPLRLSSAMRMRIGSTTKHFAALTYLLLCEEGKAKLDDPIGVHLPELGAVSRGAVMRQLMGHTSGLADILDISLLVHGSGKRITDAEMLAFYETIDQTNFPPETSWSYNNGGYIMLSVAIERLTGQPLDQVLRERIFTPLGMHDTMLRRWDSDFAPNSATLHARTADGRWTRDYMGMEISGAGGMVSTMEDMLRWLKHMDEPVVGSAETWALMRKPHTLKNGISTGYGLGLMSSTYRGVETLHHGGGVMGGNSQMIKVPAAGLDISIAVNRSDASAAVLANEIIDACVEGLEPKGEGIEVEPITAVYRSASSGRVIQLTANEKAQLASLDGGPPLPMAAGEGGKLDLPAFMAFLQQGLTLSADHAALTLLEFGNTDELARVSPPPDLPPAPEGTFEAKGFAATARLSAGPEGGTMQLSGPFGANAYGLQPLDKDVWRAASKGPFPYGAIVTLEDDGAVLGLRTGRSSVRFAKVTT